MHLKKLPLAPVLLTRALGLAKAADAINDA